MKVNQGTVDLVKRWEGLRLNAYKDVAGVWTIGYGTTARAGVGITPKAGMKITQAEAEHYLHMELDHVAEGVAGMIKVPVTPNQFGALVSLGYNIGLGALKRSSTIRYLNNGDYDRACKNIGLWNKARNPSTGKLEVVQGLKNRRADEQRFFVSTSAPDVPANSPHELDEPEEKAPVVSPVSIVIGLGVAAGAAVVSFACKIPILSSLISSCGG